MNKKEQKIFAKTLLDASIALVEANHANNLDSEKALWVQVNTLVNLSSDLLDVSGNLLYLRLFTAEVRRTLKLLYTYTYDEALNKINCFYQNFLHR